MGIDVAITSLPWDSEFWGEPAGRVHLDEHHPASAEALRDAIERAQQAFDFVQLLVPAAQIAHVQAAQRAGFLLMDLRSEVVLDRAAHVSAFTVDSSIRSAVPHDVASIAELAAICHGNSRFGSDPALDPTKIEEFYREWIRRDVSMPGWALAAAERHGRVVGYVSYGSVANGDGTIGLVGVSPTARGAGLGLQLVAHAVESLFALGCPRMTVITHGGNAPAMRMYQACGFEVTRFGYWLHWHRANHGSRV
jgi:ribosomal protein S18 acetylase RimI-like enzyme